MWLLLFLKYRLWRHTLTCINTIRMADKNRRKIKIKIHNEGFSDCIYMTLTWAIFPLPFLEHYWLLSWLHTFILSKVAIHCIHLKKIVGGSIFISFFNQKLWNFVPKKRQKGKKKKKGTKVKCRSNMQQQKRRRRRRKSERALASQKQD